MVRCIADYYGCNVFNDAAMAVHLPKNIYRQLRQTIEDGTELDAAMADIVAHGMKEWALENGATHYTHWFQPLNGVTAQKHDSFISAPGKRGKVIMEFSGKELIMGEPDASSFPSGGLRATFEARGYTAWDCTSPAFLIKDTIGVVLCIPTAFCSYKGEALDGKTPLLRSMQAVNTQSLRILRLFGNTTSKRVVPSVGAEQEYFLINHDKYLKRPDLIYSGRTLFGAMPPKGQEMDDHYFGVIRDKAAAYMNDLNHELWKLGVPAKTQHNEAAPSQHELAPVYEQVNVATDHNHLIMETMKRVALRHGLSCLLHEKPFAGVNGSGKHNNWSLVTNDGINMLNPGDTPHENIQFLLVLACILKAVDIHADLLRETAAVLGNEQRLGVNEAPPSIISVFLGEQLEDVLDQLCATGEAVRSKSGGMLKTGVATLPDFEKDATDRNRTSPFAFTNNKFEFRMLGASESISSANVVLNTIVAEAFKEAADKLENTADFDMEVHNLIKALLSEHRRIVFNGNGYSKEWVEEAKRRGLPNLKSMVDAIGALKSEKAVKLFESFGVYTRAELESRSEIEFEAYTKAVAVEAKTMLDMTGKLYIPAIIKYIGALAHSMNEVKVASKSISVEVQENLLKECTELLTQVKEAYSGLDAALDKAKAIKEKNNGDCGYEAAHFYHDSVVAAMERLRSPVDKLEIITDKNYWPVPGYGDMLFETM